MSKDFVDLLHKEIEELQKAIKEPIKCNETATEISSEYARRVMLENQLFYKQGCLSKNYYYEHQISVLEKALELACRNTYCELCPLAIQCDDDSDNCEKSLPKWYIEQAQKEIKNE